MGNNSNKFEMDFSQLKVKKNGYDWKNSIGLIIKFSSEKLNGELKIVDYIPVSKSKIKSATLILSYNDNILDEICVHSLRSGNLGGILFNYLFEWKYEIGETIVDKDKNITIINRKYENGKQLYQIKCNNCGFDSGLHYVHYKNNIEERKEYWITSDGLKKLKQCPCCRKNTRIVVSGINDIPTTDSWMISYFQGGEEEARLYTHSSHKKINFKCPDCCRVKKNAIMIYNLYESHSIGCICNDNMSFPNKFIYFLCEQLKNELDYFKNEYSPKWANRYKYDMYIVYKSCKYIIEMDGALGHGNKKYRSNEKDIDGIKIDKIKDMLAKDNDAKLIRIDCIKSDFDYIKQNIINKLSNILPIEKIDWDLLKSQCYRNINKDICDYYNKTSSSVKSISKHFNLNKTLVLNALNLGNELGLCNFISRTKIKENNKEIVKRIKTEHPEYSAKDISRITGINSNTVNHYIKLFGMFDKELSEKRRIERMKEKVSESKSKKVYVYDLNRKFLGEYISVTELSRKSENDFGIKLIIQGISRVCMGERKQYKGYIFSYIKLYE